MQIGAFGENDRRVSSCQGDPEDGLAAAEGDSSAAHSHSRAPEAELREDALICSVLVEYSQVSRGDRRHDNFPGF